MEPLGLIIIVYSWADPEFEVRGGAIGLEWKAGVRYIQITIHFKYDFLLQSESPHTISYKKMGGADRVGIFPSKTCFSRPKWDKPKLEKLGKIMVNYISRREIAYIVLNWTR